MRLRQAQRKGATLVECAFVYPVLLLLLFGLIVGGLGIFRYHQVAHLAREAARYASCHGLDYHRETGNPAATADSIYQNVVVANAAGLDPNYLGCTVVWDTSNAPKRVNADMTVTTNVVEVTVSYQWLPELYFGGVTLTSKSKMPMSY